MERIKKWLRADMPGYWKESRIEQCDCVREIHVMNGTNEYNHARSNGSTCSRHSFDRGHQQKVTFHKPISFGRQLLKVTSSDNRFLFLCNHCLAQRKRIFSRHNWQPEANSQTLPWMGVQTILWFKTRQRSHERVVPGGMWGPKHWSVQREGYPSLRRCQQGFSHDLEVPSLSWQSGNLHDLMLTLAIKLGLWIWFHFCYSEIFYQMPCRWLTTSQEVG